MYPYNVPFDIFPVEDFSILSDTFSKGWQVESTGGAEMPNLTSAGPVLLGEVASAFQVEPENSTTLWEVAFLPLEPVNFGGYKALRFAIHPGGAKGKFGSVFRIRINDEQVDLIMEGLVDPELEDWQVVEISLKEFDPADPIRSIHLVGNLEGTFYLDDMRLVAAQPPPITAVLEDHTDIQPQSFTLDHNFPNPFNSETVIRFDLPVSAEIDLAVYNLAGQKAATLALGLREAGAYTLRWDGRDDDGRELASGVYLYRLTAADRAAARKLLLLR